MGLSLQQVVRVINAHSSPYFCKECIQLSNFSLIVTDFASADPGIEVFSYNEDFYTLGNTDDSILSLNGSAGPILSAVRSASETVCGEMRRLADSVAAVQAVVADVSVSPRVAPPRKTFSEIVRQGVAPPVAPEGAGASAVSARSSAVGVVRDVEPGRSFVVERVDVPAAFRDTVKVRKQMMERDAALVPLISVLKVISTGKILIEASSREEFEVLEGKIGEHIDMFGANATVRRMVRREASPRNSAVVRGVPSQYMAEMKIELGEQFTSIIKVTHLVKMGAFPKWLSIRVDLSDGAEYRKLLELGVRLGLEYLRAEPWVPAPSQCHRCLRFGHVASVCVSGGRCLNCGGARDHQSADCTRETKCANCSEAHRADHRSCPARRSALNKQFIPVVCDGSGQAKN